MSRDFGNQPPLGIGWGDDDREIGPQPPAIIWPIEDEDNG
jgi:hypothetical protein